MLAVGAEVVEDPVMDRRKPLAWAVGCSAALVLVFVLVFPTAIVDLLSPSSVELDLEGRLDTQRRLSLPPTNGQIRLEFQPVEAAPTVRGALSQGSGTYLVDSCTRGCSVVVEPIPIGTAATLRITYVEDDSEYVNDIRFG